MASGSNPLASLVMTALQSQSGGAPPGGAPGMQSNPTGPSAGDAYAKQVAELKGADPGGLLRQLKALKQIVAAIVVQNLERLPNVSGKASKLIPMLDSVISEAMKAQNVNASVRNPGQGAGPIQMGAAQGGGGGVPSSGGIGIGA